MLRTEVKLERLRTYKERKEALMSEEEI